MNGRTESLSRGVSFEGAYPEWDLSKFVPLEVKAGTMVLFHGENVHYSAPNTSDASRHAYSVHYVVRVRSQLTIDHVVLSTSFTLRSKCTTPASTKQSHRCFNSCMHCLRRRVSRVSLRAGRGGAVGRAQLAAAPGWISVQAPRGGGGGGGRGGFGALREG